MINYIKNINYVNTLSDYKVSINPFTKILVYIINDEIVGFLDYSLIYD